MTISDWFWRYGIKRTSPGHQLPIDTWFDAVSQMERRKEAILRAKDSKACVVAWGVSQTGKSTLLSRYLDGEKPDGSDSALTWRKPVRFSGDENATPPDTLIFNPHTGGRDATAVATRYTLRDANDPSVNRDYPVELKFMTEGQVLHAIARGFDSECRSSRQIIDRQFFLEMLGSERQETVCQKSREAFESLQDALKVIELMQGGSHRFTLLFQDGSWEMLRAKCVSSAKLLRSSEESQNFIADLFWDGDAKISAFYRNTRKMLAELDRLWGGKRVLLTTEVARLFLNIDMYEGWAQNKGGHVVNKIRWRAQGGSILLQIGGGGEALPCDEFEAGDRFGYMQSVCRELVVPVKKEALNNSRSRVLLSFLEKADILDLPGLSRRSDDAALIETSSLGTVQFIKDVLKEGRTQSYVYNYSDTYEADAFMLMVRSTEYPLKSRILNDGIKNWMRAYDAKWTCRQAAAMPFFIDMTFFGKHVKNVMAVTDRESGPSRWQMVADWVQDKLEIADPDTAKFFLTNYPQFADGKMPDSLKGRIGEIEAEICRDPYFLKRTGLTPSDIEAVFGDDGGVDRMLAEIVKSIDVGRRKLKCEEILRETNRGLKERIAAHVPVDADAENARRLQLVNACAARFEAAVDACAKGLAGSMEYAETAAELKALFEVRPEWFVPIPVGVGRMSAPEVASFLESEVELWYARKCEEVGKSAKGAKERDEKLAVIGAMKDTLDRNELKTAFSGVTSVFPGIQNSSDGMAARFTLAIVFSNVLRTGKARVEAPAALPTLVNMVEADQEGNRERKLSPHWLLQIEPLVARIRELANVAVAAMRTPQSGDDELLDISEKLKG